MVTSKGVLVLAGIVAVVLVSAQPALPPPPVFDGVELSATCAFQVENGQYRYTYVLKNPAGNTVGFWDMDISVGLAAPTISGGFKPDGWWGVMLVGTDTPDYEGLPKKPFVSISTSNREVNPGQTSEPFGFSAGVPPQVQEAWVSPWLDPWFQAYLEAVGWDAYPLDGPEGSIAIERSYIRKIPTLAPLGVAPGSFAHWDVFLSDVTKAGSLGWVADGGLLSQIQARLSEARQAALLQDLPTVNAKLEAVVALAEGASPAQMRREAKDLIVLNGRYLKETLPWPCEPKLTAVPVSATHAVGETHTVTATLVNVATGLPIAGNGLTVEVTEGPHAGTRREGTTDGEGRLSLTYTGTRLGTDTIVVHTPYGTIRQGGAAEAPKAKAGGVRSAGRGPGPAAAGDCTAWDTSAPPVRVTWEGGPDLVVPLFIPPLLLSAPGNTFYVTESTQNRGTLPSGPSVTRYYIATSKPLDPSTAIVVGQRSIPALGPGEESEVFEIPFTVPADLPAGTYFLDACADADDRVVETSEANNCASSSLQLLAGVVPSNRPPDCSQASARPRVLWPPNHKLEDIAITGITDPDGDPVTVKVTGITQDEPTDGFGVGTPSPQVRAERSGVGNGRVYQIAFAASDGKGGSCTGAVTLGVPHDQNGTPVDDGQRYDSTR